MTDMGRYDHYTDSFIQESCEDCISREWIKTAIHNFYYGLKHIPTEEDIQAYIDVAPSVNPQEKTGHWYIDERPESNRETICSNCEKPILKYHKLDFDYRPKYCPNCGCRMSEVSE